MLEEAKEDPLACFPTEWVDFIHQRRGKPRHTRTSASAGHRREDDSDEQQRKGKDTCSLS
jgi:hypothetical protein